MRLLIDANLARQVAERLRGADFDAIHVGDLGLLNGSDSAIFDRAVADQLV